ncbi:MAG: hypothetical protein M1378_12145 [Bacteroidetes bacterium]|nr:hypothetical protein [Bacteroidota bacterium]
MSTDQGVQSSESADLFQKSWPKVFTVYRWIFILGLTGMALRFFGLWGDSDVAAIVRAFGRNDAATIINDAVIDLAVIVTLFYALLQPKRWVFVLGASMVFFTHWIAFVFVLTGITKGNLWEQLTFFKGFHDMESVSMVIAGIFPLFGFLAFPPKGDEVMVPGRNAMKLAEIGVPVLAGLLLALVPSFHFTGGFGPESTSIHGFGVGLFVGGGVIAAILGFLRRPNVLLFWGTVASMMLLETWLNVLRISGPAKPPSWPGLGMIAGILGCLLLLFSMPAARLATRLFFARRPLITESA